jgi:hypothetical protein
VSVNADKRKRRIAREVAARKAPRRGLMLAGVTGANPAVFVENYAARSIDARAPRDGGRQAWHDSYGARPYRTSTGFDSIRVAGL